MFGDGSCHNDVFIIYYNVDGWYISFCVFNHRHLILHYDYSQTI